MASGDWNLICDVCGRKIKASTAKHRWDGYIVCPEDFETRHPQDFVKAKADKQSVPFSRPEPADTFVNIEYQVNTLSCTPLGRVAVVGMAVAGCSVVGKTVNGVL